MPREAEFDSAERGHEEDAWFEERGAGPGSRDKRARVVLAVVLVALVVFGAMFGAFSSAAADGGPELERLRERARAAASPGGAAGDPVLFAGLDKLVAAMPPTPEPLADVVAASEVADAADGGAADVAATAEVDSGPTVAAKVEPPRTYPPKPKEPKEPPKPKEPKANDPTLGFPKLETKTVAPEPKKGDPKAPVEDPKLKGPLDQALADAKGHLDAGRWSEAKAGYEKALGLSAGHPRALLGRGRALLELRQVQPALKDIRAVLDADPRNPTALLLAGSISQELGQRAEARGYYQRYLDAWPSGRKAAEVKALLERL